MSTILFCPKCHKMPDIEVGFSGISFSDEGMIMRVFYDAFCHTPSCSNVISGQGKILIGRDGKIKILEDGYTECINKWNESVKICPPPF